jgi:hypothetical protein
MSKSAQVAPDVVQVLLSTKQGTDNPINLDTTYNTIISTSTSGDNAEFYLPLLVNCIPGQVFEFTTYANVGANIYQNAAEPITPTVNWIIDFDGTAVNQFDTNQNSYVKVIVSTISYSNVNYKIWRVLMNYNY